MTTEQLKQFKENLQRANDNLTKKDFETAFKQVIDFVKPEINIKRELYQLLWCLGTAIMFSIGLILSIGNTLFSYLNF